jgi:hypothetical protein
MTAMKLIEQALEKDYDYNVIELLVSRMEDDANASRRAGLVKALAKAKASFPTIQKDGKAHNGRKYATLNAIVQTVTPVLSENDLMFRFDTVQKDQTIRVVCILEHAGGGMVSAGLSAGHDNSGSKNPVQALGSAQTYLMRYTLTLVLGLSATDDDDGIGTASKPENVVLADSDDLAEVYGLVEALTAGDKEEEQKLWNGMLAALGVARIEDAPKATIPGIIKRLNKKIADKGKAND